MTTVTRRIVGLLLGLSLGLAVVLPAFAQSGGKADIIVGRIEERTTYWTLVLQVTKGELIAYGEAVRENNP